MKSKLPVPAYAKCIAAGFNQDEVERAPAPEMRVRRGGSRRDTDSGQRVEEQQ